jgi:hypothetical protein
MKTGVVGILVALVAVPTSTPAAPPETTKRPLRWSRDIDDERVDSGQPRTWLVQVHPKLPTYAITVIPRIVTPVKYLGEEVGSDWGEEGRKGEDTYVGSLVIARQGSPPHQIIHVRSSDHPSWFAKGPATEDVDFDGYADISVLYAHGAKGGWARYWLFDPRSGRFVQNALARELGALGYNELERDPEKREIRTKNFNGHCYPEERTYRIVRGHLVLMEVSAMDSSDGCVVVTKKRVGGHLKVVDNP